MRRWLLLLLLAGCGYHFTRPGGALPQGLRAVQAPVFQNRTAESGAEVVFTQALREQLNRAGTLGDDGTEARIEGVITQVYAVPMVATPGKLPSYRLTAVAELKLLKNGVQLSSAVVQGDEDLPSGADALLTDANRQAALARVAKDMMREGYERLCSGW